MKQFLMLTFSAVLLSTLFFTSCQKERVEAVTEAQTTIDESNYYTPSLSDFDIDMSSRAYWTTIPAGSTDALAQAIADADPGGIIYLKAGMHRETARVTVNKPLKIIGEDGAVLMISSSDTVATTNPAIHVINAPGTAIQNLEIRPLADGAYTAVLFENSPRSALLSSDISGFPQGVLVERSDQFAIINNTIEGTLETNGILVNNGKSNYIAGNDISNFDIAIWACDEWGTAENNDFHDNNVGVLLCKFNAIFGSTVPGNNNPIGADVTCTAWKLRSNVFANNNFAGLAVRDGSNLNYVESSNQYANNASYDILVPADEDLIPGVLFVPAAKNNTIHATPEVLIKDCGIDNTVIGGTMVDTSVDPC